MEQSFILTRALHKIVSYAEYEKKKYGIILISYIRQSSIKIRQTLRL